ncbi:SMI1/KNR4 family protein [Hoeflea prorocentri]|uniref:SMI1/KNR4 family protein n=1 Tax=Hoeflea prorocentri TaxID=1922333 RepID=A0A9X3ZGU3_9HYPH|nr:SMI1/KNR4 family protein [Hoeflea prorocentri]MCY6380248.1 SMI1/KNR4 family protein [Hoeflea prorocentri]MDA5398048.1 SMI1/KNR4 family protein [Hoeflea prorocentri]
MFKLLPDTLKYFEEHRSERLGGNNPVTLMTERDFERIERAWGYSLPEDYKHFMSTYGGTSFPCDGQSQTSYTYQEGDIQQHFECQLAGIMATDVLLTIRHHMIDDPDNEAEQPFFPTNMLPFGADPGTNLFLLELGTDTPNVWFWEDQYDAWGEGENTRLGSVASSFTDFINGLAGGDAVENEDIDVYTFWKSKQDIQKACSEDFSWMEEVWGGKIPQDYRKLVEAFGYPYLNDGEVPRWLTYKFEDPDRIVDVCQGSFDHFLTPEQMKKDRSWLTDSAEGSLIPPGYMAFAVGGGFVYFLLKLGVVSSSVYVWEESDDPWDTNDNTRIGLAANSLDEFFAQLVRA